MLFPIDNLIYATLRLTIGRLPTHEKLNTLTTNDSCLYNTPPPASSAFWDFGSCHPWGPTLGDELGVSFRAWDTATTSRR